NYTWNLKNGKDSKLSKYHISDNYIRFYLKYIAPYKTQIDRNNFEFTSLAILPGWDIIIALQFENLVLNNKQFLWQLLDINPVDIRTENPFFQRKTIRQIGCQIDYLIQTKFGSLYICEIKFSKHKIPYSIIAEVQQRISALQKPKHLSCHPVLVHVNGVDASVIESGYFAKIIDFSAAFNCII
ncbi:MAG: ATPase, partial [Legionellales bacterium]